MRAVWIAVASLACNVPYEVDPNFGIDTAIVDSDSTDTPGVDSGCTSNLECLSSPATPLCDSVRGVCVACLTSDRCAKGEYCSKTGACVAGCRDDSDCATKSDAGAGADAAPGSRCDPETHTCGGCKSDADCPSGNACCDGQCFDVKTSSAHCGGCGKACPAPAHSVMKCEASTCKVASCDAGWADCGGADDGCETDINTRSDACGACGNVCSFANGSGICAAGMCKVTSCAAGFGDCDLDATNGCETTLLDNAANCNACGNVCPATKGTPVCLAGVCKFASCGAGLADCDGSKTCSTVTSTDVNNCGGCGTTCSVANGTPTCAAGSCAINACTTGFADCNTTYADGCEKSVRTLTDCGACGVACARANATATCTTGTCAIASCTDKTKFDDCDGIDSNGCETSTTNDPLNCGGCGNSCAVANGTGGTCAASACTYKCDAGFVNCNGTLPDADGCERALGTSASTCAAPTILPDSGGGDFCGYRTSETGTATTTTSRVYRVRLRGSSCGGMCKGSDPIRARFTLTNPTGVAYDLRVYSASACTTSVASSTTGVLGGTETTAYTHASCPASLDLFVEVKWRAGSSCLGSTLTVTSAF